jgi:hypothetical protein
LVPPVALVKAAAALPALLAAAGVPAQAPAAAPSPSKQASAPAQPIDWEKAAADVVEGYRKYGADRGHLTASYLRGFADTYAMLKQANDDAQAALKQAQAEHAHQTIARSE